MTRQWRVQRTVAPRMSRRKESLKWGGCISLENYSRADHEVGGRPVRRECKAQAKNRKKGSGFSEPTPRHLKRHSSNGRPGRGLDRRTDNVNKRRGRGVTGQPWPSERK